MVKQSFVDTSESERVPEERKTNRRGRTKKLYFAPKPYKCAMGCSKAYASRSAREYHHNAVHLGVTYSCYWILCLKRFTSYYHRAAHMAKGHASFRQLKDENTKAGYEGILS